MAENTSSGTSDGNNQSQDISGSNNISSDIDSKQNNDKDNFDSSKFKNHFVQVPKLKKPQVMNHFVKGGGDMGNFQDIYKDIKTERLNQRKAAYQKAKESAPPKEVKREKGGKIRASRKEKK